MRIFSKYHFAVLGAGFFYASYAVFSGLLAEVGVTPITQIVWRGVFGAGSAFVLYRIFDRDFHLRVTPKEIHYLVINSILYLFSSMSFIGAIYLGSPIAKATLLSYAYPIVVIVLSAFLLGEKVTAKNLVAIVLSLLSIFVLFKGWEIENLARLSIADLLALLTSVFFGAVIVWGTKIRKETKLHPFLTLFYTLLLSIVLILLIGVGFEIVGSELLSISQLSLPRSIEWVYLLGLGTLGTTIPLALLYFGAKHLRSLVSGVLLATEPLWVYLFGLLLLGQVLDTSFWVALVGILVAILLV